MFLVFCFYLGSFLFRFSSFLFLFTLCPPPTAFRLPHFASLLFHFPLPPHTFLWLKLLLLFTFCDPGGDLVLLLRRPSSVVLARPSFLHSRHGVYVILLHQMFYRHFSLFSSLLFSGLHVSLLPSAAAVVAASAGVAVAAVGGDDVVVLSASSSCS